MKTQQTEQLWKAVQDHKNAATLKALIYAQVYGIMEQRKALSATEFFEIVADELNTWNKLQSK